MRNPLVILVLCLCSLTNAVPLGLKKNMAIVQEQEDPMLVMAEDEETRPEMMISRLNLPSNATSIRADITDGFSCDNKTYGYYADVENECQIFHVCLPVTYADGKENTFRWSFICPEETVFSQEYFTCMRSEDMSIDCEESFKYYELNRNFGMIEAEDVPADEPEEEMTMEDMSRQPPSQGDEEINKQSVEAEPPMKKQTVKVQNQNRRKAQANRVAIEAQRKKVQPLRRLPKPAVIATTAKPIVEESPILEQEVERTTLKYQRLTKRPIAVIPEQPKPEEPKPEKEVVRQELFAQKRKRPQIFFPSRFDAAVQTDGESKPLPYLKSDILVQKPAEPIVQNQAEAQAQASEIAEVSIKPQVELEPVESEKTETLPETMPVQKKEPAYVYIPVKEEDQPIIQLKSEIASLPENIPSRVEVVEIPIQKIDEPLMAEGSVVLSQMPEKSIPIVLPEETKPTADAIVEPIKAEEEEIPAEDILLKKIIAQTEKVVESDKPVDVEKPALDPVLEPELVSLDEPEQLLQSLKSAELPKTPEPVKIEETIMESKIPEYATLSDDLPLDKPEESLDDAKPEILLKLETPIAEHKPEESLKDPEPEVLLKAETPVEEPSLSEVPLPEKPQEVSMTLKMNVPAPEILEPEVEKPKDSLEDLPKIKTTVSEVLETQPDKTLDAEVPAPEPQILLKSEISEVKPIEPLAIEVPVLDMSLKEETPVAEIPSVAETPVPHLDMQLKLQTPALDSTEKLEKPVEVEEPSNNEEITKIADPIPVAKTGLPIETISKPLESVIEQVREETPEQQLSSEIHAEKSAEVLAEEKIQEVEASAEKDIAQSATDNEEAQSLILDFISSLVNSENSNFEEQSAILNEMSSDSLPAASVAEPVVAEASEPAKIIQSQDDQINPLYIPMMSSNDQMYQIPVQVIETPEPEPVPAVQVPVVAEPVPAVQVPVVAEPVPAVQVPVVAEPKLPLSVDDVVELVKESLDTPAEKENLVQEPSNDDPSSQPDSEEVKPIYHRYIELGSNLLKSEALTASDDEPVVVPARNEESVADNEKEVSPELPNASEKLAEPEQLALKSDLDSESNVQAVQAEKLTVEEKQPDSQPLIESLKEGRSLNRFKMDPRKRRFLFRSDAS